MKKNIYLFILTSLFSISSQAVNPQKGNYFLYCHMSDKGQWTAYAVSKDAENWEDIIGGDSIFSSFKLAGIEGGTRDAYISRSWDGKRYVMVTTDMNNSKTKALGARDLLFSATQMLRAHIPIGFLPFGYGLHRYSGTQAMYGLTARKAATSYTTLS